MTTHSVITIRQAGPAEAILAAKLMHLSLGDLAHFLSGKPNNEATDKILADLFAKEDGRFSHRFASIAEVDRQAAGLLLAYPSSNLLALDLVTGRHLLTIFGLMGMLRLISRSLPLAAGREAGRVEYYISNLAVLPPFQRQNVGTRLLAQAEKDARAAGLPKCSLVVDLHNHDAIRLYERSGYHIVYTKRLHPPHIFGGDGYHCMVKHLS